MRFLLVLSLSGKDSLKALKIILFQAREAETLDKAKIAEMERLIGCQAKEIDFLKNLLKRLKESEG